MCCLGWHLAAKLCRGVLTRAFILLREFGCRCYIDGFSCGLSLSSALLSFRECSHVLSISLGPCPSVVRATPPHRRFVNCDHN